MSKKTQYPKKITKQDVNYRDKYLDRVKKDLEQQKKAKEEEKRRARHHKEELEKHKKEEQKHKIEEARTLAQREKELDLIIQWTNFMEDETGKVPLPDEIPPGFTIWFPVSSTLAFQDTPIIHGDIKYKYTKSLLGAKKGGGLKYLINEINKKFKGRLHPPQEIETISHKIMKEVVEAEEYIPSSIGVEDIPKLKKKKITFKRPLDSSLDEPNSPRVKKTYGNVDAKIDKDWNEFMNSKFNEGEIPKKLPDIFKLEYHENTILELQKHNKFPTEILKRKITKGQFGNLKKLKFIPLNAKYISTEGYWDIFFTKNTEDDKIPNFPFPKDYRIKFIGDKKIQVFRPRKNTIIRDLTKRQFDDLQGVGLLIGEDYNKPQEDIEQHSYTIAQKPLRGQAINFEESKKKTPSIFQIPKEREEEKIQDFPIRRAKIIEEEFEEEISSTEQWFAYFDKDGNLPSQKPNISKYKITIISPQENILIIALQENTENQKYETIREKNIKENGLSDNDLHKLWSLFMKNAFSYILNKLPKQSFLLFAEKGEISEFSSRLYYYNQKEHVYSSRPVETIGDFEVKKLNELFGLSIPNSKERMSSTPKPRELSRNDQVKLSELKSVIKKYTLIDEWVDYIEYDGEGNIPSEPFPQDDVLSLEISFLEPGWVLVSLYDNEGGSSFLLDDKEVPYEDFVVENKQYLVSEPVKDQLFNTMEELSPSKKIGSKKRESLESLDIQDFGEYYPIVSLGESSESKEAESEEEEESASVDDLVYKWMDFFRDDGELPDKVPEHSFLTVIEKDRKIEITFETALEYTYTKKIDADNLSDNNLSSLWILFFHIKTEYIPHKLPNKWYFIYHPQTNTLILNNENHNTVDMCIITKDQFNLIKKYGFLPRTESYDPQPKKLLGSPKKGEIIHPIKKSSFTRVEAPPKFQRISEKGGEDEYITLQEKQEAKEHYNEPYKKAKEVFDLEEIFPKYIDKSVGIVEPTPDLIREETLFVDEEEPEWLSAEEKYTHKYAKIVEEEEPKIDITKYLFPVKDVVEEEFYGIEELFQEPSPPSRKTLYNSNKNYGVQCRNSKTYYTHMGKVISKKRRDELIKKDKKYEKHDIIYKCLNGKILYYDKSGNLLSENEVDENAKIIPSQIRKVRRRSEIEKYIKVIAKNKQVMYFYGGRRIKSSNIPQNILDELDRV